MTDSYAERRAALIAGCLAAPLVCLTILVAAGFGPLLSFDAGVVRSWHGAVAGNGWGSFFAVVADVGQPTVVRVAMAAVAVVLVVRRRRLVAAWVVASVAVNDVAWLLTKQLVHRPRPDLLHQIAGWSYPSGHAAEIAAGATILVTLTRQGVRRRRLRACLVTLWVLIAALVGVDRVMVGAHNPSDVLAGWLIGVLVVFVLGVLFGVVSTDRATAVERPLSSLPEHRKTLAVVLNPTKVGDADAFKARVGRAARAAGWDEPLWFETTIDDAGSSMARAAVAAGADVVAAAGGDGTIRVVCAEMAGTGIPVGVVPLGTGNLLARNLGIPLGYGDALTTVLGGQDRAIDCVAIEGDGLPATRFTVMAGMGLDAAIMDGAPASLKRTMGWPAYFVSGATRLAYPAIRVDIRVDGKDPVRRRARTVLIGNVGTLTGGITLLPDARIDDGVLDVVVIAPRRLLGWLSLVWRVLTKHPGTDERLDRFTGKSVVVTAAGPTPRQLDGDTVGAGAEMRAQIQPGVLLVRVPR